MLTGGQLGGRGVATEALPKDALSRVERRRFSADEYHRMAEVGILHEDERVELVYGEIVLMPPVGGRHVDAVNRLTASLSGRSDLLVSVQNPVPLGEHGELQPDVAVIRDRDYRGQLPTPEDVQLVVEVADTSIGYDRNVKLPIYALAGIPEAWLVDVRARTIERHTEPEHGAYTLVRKAGPGGRIESAQIPGLVIEVDRVLRLDPFEGATGEDRGD